MEREFPRRLAETNPILRAEQVGQIGAQLEILVMYEHWDGLAETANLARELLLLRQSWIQTEKLFTTELSVLLVAAFWQFMEAVIVATQDKNLFVLPGILALIASTDFFFWAIELDQVHVTQRFAEMMESRGLESSIADQFQVTPGLKKLFLTQDFMVLLDALIIAHESSLKRYLSLEPNQILQPSTIARPIGILHSLN